MNFQIPVVFLCTMSPELLNSGLRFSKAQEYHPFAQRDKIKQKGSEEKETFMSF